ncbi:acyloxyacyl hydrolase [Aequorivita sp. H23M31]|uniref:Acyloxyacyl hydrolase n=1 Tax=Aequorivita ciconiae TaxID=2494375 RepID=A0A410G6B6_9FLAO|nr:acyloxyacyl hydrolase [Aequorivita sp. H23M31]QAA82838.1 acyloxyacyl hydrolase [Aequorivita sp. H23M31]
MKPSLAAFAVFLFAFPLFSQEEEKKPVSLEADFFYGNILEHNPAIQHLITGHPTGFILSYNRKTYGFNEWERRYNYPDWGFSMTYQNLHNEYLGDALGVYGHINWYFLNRNLRLQVGEGIAYMFKPYDTDSNYYNNAYGSHLVSSTFIKGSFIRENLWKGLGFNVGLAFIHYSNGNLKAPNTSTNTIALNAGINYLLDYKEFPEYIDKEDSLSSSYAQKIAYNLEFRAGINESDVIGSGQEPFYEVSFYADKRLNYKSTIQVGAEVFFSTFLKEVIKFRSIAYPEDGLTGKEDYKRVGVFVGHELRFNKVAAITQLGYYVYWPYEFENRIYVRLGLKRYFSDDRFFATASVHSHWAKAEAVEFGLGVRL